MCFVFFTQKTDPQYLSDFLKNCTKIEKPLGSASKPGTQSIEGFLKRQIHLNHGNAFPKQEFGIEVLYSLTLNSFTNKHVHDFVSEKCEM